MYSLIIKNGHLIDKASGLDCIADIAVNNGRIAGIGHFDASESNCVADASDCIVTPGLIDMHAHIYPLLPVGIQPESACFSTGVTTAVDAGSSGCATYPLYRPFIKNSMLRMKVFINVSTAGIISYPTHENVDPAGFDKGRIKAVLDEFGDEIMGLKIRVSRNVVENFGIKPLFRALEIADELNVPIMVHPTDPPCEMSVIMDALRKDDILTHTYHNIGPTIIDGSGHVCESAWRARERGVLFDVANDRQHFGFDTAICAMRDGFLPDVITSDLVGIDVFRHPTVFSLPMLASRYLMLGMKLEDILYLMTAAPARIMGISNETGALKTGLDADLAVFRMIDKEVEFGDRPYGHPELTVMKGNRILKPMMTVRSGSIVFRDCEI